jgi:hypothetical protein
MCQFRSSRFTLSAALLIVVAMATTCWAVSTSYWEVQRPEQFNQGTLDGVSIRSDGKVVLGPAIDLLSDTGESVVWCLAVAPNGDLFAGTGNNGKIIGLTGDDQQTIWQDSEELEILSLIAGPDKHLYAGTSPGGKILRISPDGQTDVFFDTGEEHVWSLAFDDDGHLYGGTGTEGKIFRVTRSGQGELFYDTNETNITVLAWHGEHLFAGGSGGGLIYKFDRRGQGLMVFDAEEEEICGLVFGADGQLYVAATSGERPVGRPPVQEKGQKEKENSGENSQQAGFFMEQPEEIGEFGMQLAGPSTVYQIDEFGSGQPLWRAPEGDMIFSMAMGPEGDLVVGTGDEGRIYSVSPTGDWSLLADLEESQVLALQTGDRKGMLVGTGNLGVIHLMKNGYGHQGTLESEVNDAVVVARWGRISWEALEPSGTQVTLQTRSGNSEVPDETWSSWSQRYDRAEGQEILSPPARFIQWRADLSTSREERTPSLEKIWLAYLPKNLAPKIQGLYVHPPGSEDGSGKASSRPEGGISGFSEGGAPGTGDPFGVAGDLATGARKVSWQAYDPNGDALAFDLFFRGRGEQNWKLLKKDLSAISYSWDSNLFPDGVYRLKLEVSDRPSNPDQLALGAERISDPFVVDNTAPKVEVRREGRGEGRYQVSGQVSDELSPIVELWYSLDAEDWKPLAVSDDVFDSPRETFSFLTDALSSGEHTVVIRAMDMAGNVGVGKVVMK